MVPKPLPPTLALLLLLTFTGVGGNAPVGGGAGGVNLLLLLPPLPVLPVLVVDTLLLPIVPFEILCCCSGGVAGTGAEGGGAVGGPRRDRAVRLLLVGLALVELGLVGLGPLCFLMGNSSASSSSCASNSNFFGKLSSAAETGANIARFICSLMLILELALGGLSGG